MRPATTAQDAETEDASSTGAGSSQDAAMVPPCREMETRAAEARDAEMVAASTLPETMSHDG